MKTLSKMLLILLPVMLIPTVLHAETTTTTFSDPSKPGVVVVTGNGDVTITGYSGSDVVIMSDIHEHVAVEDEKQRLKQRENNNEKARGLKKISSSSVSVSSSKEDNTIQISRSIQNDTDLVLKVPYNTMIKTGSSNNRLNATVLPSSGFERSIQNIVVNSVSSVFTGLGGGIMEGDIEISGITGDIEASSLEGDITLKDVSGTMLVNSVDGDIEVVFKKGAKIKPMSLSTVDGDIDVTLPQSAKMTIKASLADGDVYTDFEIEMKRIITKEQKSEEPAVSVFGISQSNTVNGEINGGGTDIRMSSIDGDIYIRKDK